MAISCMLWGLLIASSLPSASSVAMVTSRESLRVHAQMDSELELTAGNVIRKVLRLLEDLAKKNAEQGAEEDEMEKKRACKCAEDLAKQKALVEYYQKNLPALEAEYTELHSKVHMLKLDIRKQEQELEKAKQELKDIDAQYEKGLADRQQQLKDYQANMLAIRRAIDALRKGLGAEGGASFLQSTAADTLRKLVGDANMKDSERDTLGAFLDVDRADADRPGTEEIVGILRQMVDTMKSDHDELEKNLNADYDSYMQMKNAKMQQIAEIEASLRADTRTMGEYMVRIAEVEAAIKEILHGGYLREKELYDAMLAACNQGKSVYEKRKKLRAEEANALTECIKLLSSDEALELFKKTLPPGSSASLLQMQVSEKQLLTQARSALEKLRRGKHDYRVDLISFLLMGKKVDMTKVSTMIDELVGVLNKEMQDDLDKKTGCEEDFAEAKLKSMRLHKQLGPIGPILEGLRDEFKKFTSEIDRLTQSLKDRMGEIDNLKEDFRKSNGLYMKESAEDGAAYDLLRVAKQRLTNFYGSYLQELQLEDSSISEPKKPATQNGQEVISELTKIMSGLHSEMAANKADAANAQKQYDSVLAGFEKAQAAELELLEQYKDDRAQLDLRIQKHEDENRELVDAQMSHDLYVQSLHKTCDWLLSNFEYRKEAREGEIKSLRDAKMVLNGAEGIALVQEKTLHQQVKPMLRGSSSV